MLAELGGAVVVIVMTILGCTWRLASRLERLDTIVSLLKDLPGRVVKLETQVAERTAPHSRGHANGATASD